MMMIIFVSHVTSGCHLRVPPIHRVCNAVLRGSGPFHSVRNAHAQCKMTPGPPAARQRAPAPAGASGQPREGMGSVNRDDRPLAVPAGVVVVRRAAPAAAGDRQEPRSNQPAPKGL